MSPYNPLRNGPTEHGRDADALRRNAVVAARLGRVPVLTDAELDHDEELWAGMHGCDEAIGLREWNLAPVRIENPAQDDGLGRRYGFYEGWSWPVWADLYERMIGRQACACFLGHYLEPSQRGMDSDDIRRVPADARHECGR